MKTGDSNIRQRAGAGRLPHVPGPLPGYFLDRLVSESRPAPLRLTGRPGTMRKNGAIVLYVLALVAVVVGVDVLFFRHDLWERLIVNVGIVLVFGAIYLKFLRRA